MPTKRHPITRRRAGSDLEEGFLLFLLDGVRHGEGDDLWDRWCILQDLSFNTRPEVLAIWEARRDELVARWRQSQPSGSFPWAWWEFDAPELERRGGLTRAQRAHLAEHVAAEVESGRRPDPDAWAGDAVH